MNASVPSSASAGKIQNVGATDHRHLDGWKDVVESEQVRNLESAQAADAALCQASINVALAPIRLILSVDCMSSLAVMSTHGGHSADVKMRLLLDGRVLPVAQLGPDFLILDQGVEHPPATAEIVLTVDDHQKRWTVGLSIQEQFHPEPLCRQTGKGHHASDTVTTSSGPGNSARRETTREMPLASTLHLPNRRMKPVSRQLLPTDEPRLLTVRGVTAVLDSDLAALYGVTTGNFNKAVARNLDRFPGDFTFVPNKEESRSLIFQIGTSKGRGGRRKLPRVFTERGALMAATVLNSDRAVAMSLYIVRAFVRIREQRRALGTRQRTSRPWSIQEDRLLGTTSDHALARRFGRSVLAVAIATLHACAAASRTTVPSALTRARPR